MNDLEDLNCIPQDIKENFNILSEHILELQNYNNNNNNNNNEETDIDADEEIKTLKEKIDVAFKDRQNSLQRIELLKTVLETLKQDLKNSEILFQKSQQQLNQVEENNKRLQVEIDNYKNSNNVK